VYRVNRKKLYCLYFLWYLLRFLLTNFYIFSPFRSEMISAYIWCKICHLIFIALLHYLTEYHCTKCQHFLCIPTIKDTHLVLLRQDACVKQGTDWPVSGTYNRYRQPATGNRSMCPVFMTLCLHVLVSSSSTQWMSV